MRPWMTLVSSLLLAACAAHPARTPAPAEQPSLPPPGIKMATSATTSVSASMAAASAANPYVACKIVFYDSPPRVPDREIVPLCERNGNQVFYASGYSEKDQRAIWSAYRLTARMVQRIDDNDLDRSGYSFKKNDKLDALEVSQPSDADYTNSQLYMRGKKYQRGHYAPAEAMSWAEPALEASFLLTNIGPQFGTMNGGIWSCFERSVREWADEWDTMYVVVGGAVSAIGKIGNANVTVPSLFFAVIVRKDTGAALGITVPNDGSHEFNLSGYMKPISTVERESGVTFDIPRAAKEAMPNPTEWPNTCGRKRNTRDET